MKEQQQPMALIVSYINELMDPECIFCFSSRTTDVMTNSVFTPPGNITDQSGHYDLLVITETDHKHQPYLTVRLENIDHTDITITLLIHNLQTVKDKLANNNRFFHSVISSAEIVCLTLPALPAEFIAAMAANPFDPAADKSKTIKFLENSYGHIDTYIDLAARTHEPHITVPLISKGVEEVCLMLIYVMTGYEPKDYMLSELLDLCDSVDSRFRRLIPLVTEANQYHHEVLVQGFWKGRYGKDREPILEHLRKYFDDLTDLATSLCEQKLGMLKN